jgi:hypothetical protein
MWDGEPRTRVKNETVARHRSVTIGLVAAWALAAAGGSWALASYSLRAGSDGAPAPRWPAESSLQRSPSGPTLLLFAHGGCPCTQASLSELERLLARAARGVDAQVVVHGPEELGTELRDSPVGRRAAAMAGVTLVGDPGGREAVRFGAATSGHVMLYDSSGALCWSGGITPSRGHEGANAGSSALSALLGGRSPREPSTPVFGCAIRDSGLGARP